MSRLTGLRCYQVILTDNFNPICTRFKADGDQITSDNMLLLYALELKLCRSKMEAARNGFVKLKQIERQSAIEFLSKVKVYALPESTNIDEFTEYLDADFDLLFLIQVKAKTQQISDSNSSVSLSSDFSSWAQPDIENAKHNQPVQSYLFYLEQTRNLLEDKINSFDLQLLNVKSSHKLARHYYAFAKDNALANLIIVQGSIDIVGQHIKERYMTEDTVAVYGHRLAVGQFIQDITGLLEEQIQSRIVSEEQANNFIWRQRIALLQKNNYARVFSEEKCKYLLYLSKHPIEFSLITCDSVPEKSVQQMLALLPHKQSKAIRKHINYSPNLMIGKEEKLIFGTIQEIDKLKLLCVLLGSPANPLFQQREKKKLMPRRIQRVPRMVLNEDNYQSFIENVISLKASQNKLFRLDLKNGMNVFNRVRGMSFIYIVFSQPHELVELQSLLDVEWNLIKTKEIIEAFERDQEQLKTIEIGRSKLFLYYRRKKEGFEAIIQIVNKMAEQSLKVLLCKSNYLPELLNLHQNIRCNLCLAVYEDDLHVLQEVADAVPIQLTNQSNLDVLKLIESILLFQNKLNKEGSKLSAIKSYLAEQLLEQGNTEYEFPMKTVDSSQFVHLTFLGKTYRYNNDTLLEETTLKAMLPPVEYKLYSQTFSKLRKHAIINRLDFFYICMPIKEMQIVQLQGLVCSNDYLKLLYWQQRVQNTPFSIELRPYCPQNFTKLYEEEFTMSFKERTLCKLIEQTQIGYGKIRKFRSNDGKIGFTSSRDITRNMLEQLMKNHKQQ